MTAEEEVHCEWKQLIKVLLPVGRLPSCGRSTMEDKGLRQFKLRSRKLKMGTIMVLVMLNLVLVFDWVGADGGSGKGKQGQIIRSTTITEDGNDSSSSERGGADADRVEKVKAKWKGENFWSQSVSNLTLMESQKTKAEHNESPTPTTTSQDLSSSSRKMVSSSPTQATFFEDNSMFRSDSVLSPVTQIDTDVSNLNYTIVPPKKRSKKHKKKSHSTKFNLPKTSPKPSAKSTGSPVPRTTFSADLSQFGYVLEYESSEGEGEREDEGESENLYESPEEVISTSTTPRVKIISNPRISTKPKTKSSSLKGSKNRVTQKTKIKKKRNNSKYGSTFGFRRTTNSSTESLQEVPQRYEENETPPAEPDDDMDRGTLLTADLSPYQNAYLEYESDENVSSENKNDTANGTLEVQFFPKNPVNLLNVLQVLASNLQPIKMTSPVGGEVPPIPLRYNVNITNRVPMTVNPPTSPFLFSLDLDSFFTRMAISLFYSGIAIAPLIYLMMGGLGTLGGLSIVPFGGKRKRRKRRSAHKDTSSDEDNFNFYDEQEIQQLELAMDRFWKFLSSQM